MGFNHVIPLIQVPSDTQKSKNGLQVRYMYVKKCQKEPISNVGRQTARPWNKFIFTEIVRSDFSRGSDDWVAVEDDVNVKIRYDGIGKYIGLRGSLSDMPVYFVAPSKYLPCGTLMGPFTDHIK